MAHCTSCKPCANVMQPQDAPDGTAVAGPDMLSAEATSLVSTYCLHTRNTPTQVCCKPKGTHATLLGELIVRKNMIATKRKTPALAQKPMCPAHAQPLLDGRRGSKVGCLNPKPDPPKLKGDVTHPKEHAAQRGMHAPRAAGFILQWRLHGQGLAQLMAQRRNGLWLIPESRKTILGGHDACGEKEPGHLSSHHEGWRLVSLRQAEPPLEKSGAA